MGTGTTRKRNKRRLATNCCACGMLLSDSKSVEIGMGPTCREKYGLKAAFAGFSESKRKRVNKLIHEAGIACEANEVQTVFDLSDKIEKAGLGIVADKVRNRFIDVRLIEVKDADEYGWTKHQGEFLTGKKHDIVRVWTPYSPNFNRLRRDNRLRGRPCKVTTPHGKFHWEFKRSDSRLLLKVLALAFPGQAAFGDRGAFIIPTHSEFAAKYETS